LSDGGAWNSSNDVAIGGNITGVEYSGSVALGYGAGIPANNTFVVGGTGVNAIAEWVINTVAYNMPSAQGAANTYLENDGSGNLSWTTIPGGSASLTSTYIGYGNGSNILTGDANFVRNSYGIELQDNSTNGNIFIGVPSAQAGNSTLTGHSSVGIGISALADNTTGSLNVAIGGQALKNNSTGSDLIGIGCNVFVSTPGLTNSVGIGTFSAPTNLITESNQFAVAPTIVNWNIGGVPYVLPTSQGAASTVLSNDGSGNLSWQAATYGGTPGLTSTYIGYGSGSNTLTGSPHFVYDGSTFVLNSYNGIGYDTILYSSGTSHSSAVSFLAGNISLGMDAFGISDGGCRIGDITIPSHTFLCTDSKYSLAGVNYVFPASQGTASTVLTNDGSGNLSWAAPGGGSGGTHNIELLGTLSGAVLHGSSDSDQLITLSGGANYIITNVMYTNSSNLNNNSISVQINTQAAQAGIWVENNNESLYALNASNQFVDWNVGYSQALLFQKPTYIWNNNAGGGSNVGYVVQSPVYFSINSGAVGGATVDIYVYGYVLN